MKKKIIVLISILILIVIILFLYVSTTRRGIKISNTENIIKIDILQSFQAVPKTTRNKDEIAKVVNYINGLKTRRTFKDLSQYLGLGYLITVYYDDKKNEEYFFYGNEFIRNKNKWYEVDISQYVEFNDIYSNIGNK